MFMGSVTDAVSLFALFCTYMCHDFVFLCFLFYFEMHILLVSCPVVLFSCLCVTV